MPSFFSTLPDEEIIWAVLIATFEMPENPTESDKKFYQQKVEERVRRLEEAETRYKWFSLKWDKKMMKKMLINWFCGMMVIDPDLKTKDGSPIQWVREFYGEESKYPDTANQTDEWKNDVILLYVLMVRSTCKAYPESLSKGIVSFSDMADFDWTKYDMETKSRNAEIGSLIPNKLKSMITIRPDEKMQGFYKDMTPRMRKKYGFRQYDNFDRAMKAEADVLTENIPTFVGGEYKIDIMKCLEFLFKKEPEVWELCQEVYKEMNENNEIPMPSHMK